MAQVTGIAVFDYYDKGDDETQLLSFAAGEQITILEQVSYTPFFSFYVYIWAYIQRLHTCMRLTRGVRTSFYFIF